MKAAKLEDITLPQLFFGGIYISGDDGIFKDCYFHEVKPIKVTRGGI